MPSTLTAPGGAVRPAPGPDDAGTHRVRAGVPIMPTHERTIVLRDPQSGRVIRDAEGRPRRKTLVVDADALAAIAADANERTARGNDCPITIGHFQLYEPDETKQPEIVGFMRNYRVGPRLDDAGEVVDPAPHLIADLHIERNRWDEALTYPRRSTEIDPDFADPARSSLDSLALLRRHPEHEMGLLTYARDPSAVEAYTLEDPEAPPRGAGPQAPDPGEDNEMADEMNAEAPLLTPEQLQAIEAAVIACLDRLAGQAEEAPAEEEAPEVQNEAAAPSGTNTFAPEMAPEKKDDEMQNCDSAQKVQYSRQVTDLSAEFKALKAENAKLTRRLEENEEWVGEMMIQNCRATIAKELDGLEAEGVAFDREAEAAELLELAGQPDKMSRHLTRMRTQYARSPMNNGFVADALPRAKSGRTLKSKDEMDRIVAIASRKNIPFAEAKELFFSGAA